MGVVHLANSQIEPYHKCGPLDENQVRQALEILGDHWGYGYDQLLTDLENWENSEQVEISSIGHSVEGRPLWELKLTDPGIPDSDKATIYLHARTHAAEVQSTWVINAIIEFLLSDAVEAEIIRSKCIFYLLPMYNPDGVELEYPRQNANNIDIESNWYSPEIQPEVISLRARFQLLMSSPSPIDIALNMHSAFACKRYFVYHHENGTSQQFTELERSFISGVKGYYPDGIEAWDYYISWTNGTPLKYPESWWWTNFGASVMALTYEDMNCAAAGNYDHTAIAIVKGIADFLEIDLTSSNHQVLALNEILGNCYPNPFNRTLHSRINFPVKVRENSSFKLELINNQGRRIETSFIQNSTTNSFQLDPGLLKPGVYTYRLITEEGTQSKKLIIM